MIYYYLVFFITTIIAIGGDVKIKKISSIFIAIILILFAGTRLNVDNDYHMYYKLFQYMENTLEKFKNRDVPLEWSMYFFPYIFKIFNNTSDSIKACFALFAVLGVSTKIIAIKKYSEYFLLSITLYIGYLFLMMEMTTIRAGVAAGIFMLSLKNLEENNNKKFFIKLLCCFFFHSSSVLYIIPWILFKYKINIRLYYIAILISLFSTLLKINILTLFFLDRIFPKVQDYLKIMEWQKESGVNVLNFRVLFAVLIIIAGAVFYRKLKVIKYFEILFKIHIISLCFFLVFSNTSQVFSTRTFEMFAVMQILLYPLMIRIFPRKVRLIGWTIIILYSCVQIYYLIEVADIYKPYKSWLLN